MARGVNKRKRSRIRELNKDINRLEEVQASESRVSHALDDELFAVDTDATQNVPKKQRSVSHRRKNQHGVLGSSETKSTPVTVIDQKLDSLLRVSERLGEYVDASDSESDVEVERATAVKLYKRKSPQLADTSKNEKKKIDALSRKLATSSRKGECVVSESLLGTRVRPTAPVASDGDLHDLWSDKKPIKIHAKSRERKIVAKGTHTGKDSSELDFRELAASNLARSLGITNLEAGKSRHIHEPSGRRASVAAVPVAHPGASYNPSHDDHQDALGEIVAEELDTIEKIKKVQKALYRDPNYAQQLDDSSHESDSEVDEPDETHATPQARRLEKRKTTVQLNRRAKHNDSLKAIAVRKRDRKILKQIENASGIIKEIESQEQDLIRRKQERAERKTIELNQQKQKGIRAGQEMQRTADMMEVALSDQLSTNLRSMRSVPATRNLLADRFSNMVYQRQLADRGRKQVRRKKWVKILKK